MKQTDTQPLFSVVWAQNADSSTLATIPQSATAIGRASLAMGFPKATMTPIAAGGVPPYGEDMNGILNMLSRAARAAELGVLLPFSAEYANAIGGYPAGATVAHPTVAGRFLVCTSDNNTNDPGKSMNGWIDPLAGFQASGDYATNTSLNTEVTRAKTAEAGLLPLTGGTVTGPIARDGGGVLPEVIGLGLTGRVVIQSFTIDGNGAPYWVTFPKPFKDGTTPYVTALINSEVSSGTPSTASSRVAVLLNNADGTPNITSAGFLFQACSLSTVFIGNTSYHWRLNVIAVGVLA